LLWAPFAALVAASVAPLWWSAVLPGQDLPAHLAYARILRDHADPALPFGAAYRLGATAQPYFTTLYLLIFLGRMMSLLTAARVVATAYVLALYAAVFFAARVAQPQEPRDRPPAAVFLAAPLVWNPAAAMGFLLFVVTVPLVVAGAGVLLLPARGREQMRAAVLVGLCGVAGSLHVYALVCLLLVATLFALWERERRSVTGLLAVVAGAAATLAIWRAAGEVGVSEQPIAWREALRAAIGFEAITDAFRVAWGTPPLKLTYAFYTAFGPFGVAGQLVTIAGVVALLVVHRRSGARASAEQRRRLKVAGTFALVAALLPWGIHIPTELTFIDLRTLTVAALLLVPLLPPEAFVAGRGRMALLAFALACTVNLQVQVAFFARESRPVLRLLAQVLPAERLAYLSFGGGAAGWGGQFRLTHNLPLYHVVKNGGLAPQLWGRYTAHLPVEPVREPVVPPVWQPWEVQARELAEVDALLVQEPPPDATARATSGFNRLGSLLEPRFRQVTCAGSWCLYRRDGQERGQTLPNDQGLR
jgi:hypothetical protein